MSTLLWKACSRHKTCEDAGLRPEVRGERGREVRVPEGDEGEEFYLEVAVGLSVPIRFNPYRVVSSYRTNALLIHVSSDTSLFQSQSSNQDAFPKNRERFESQISVPTRMYVSVCALYVHPCACHPVQADCQILT